jgi:hypothetical protein
MAFLFFKMAGHLRRGFGLSRKAMAAERLGPAADLVIAR